MSDCESLSNSMSTPLVTLETSVENPIPTVVSNNEKRQPTRSKYRRLFLIVD